MHGREIGIMPFFVLMCLRVLIFRSGPPTLVCMKITGVFMKKSFIFFIVPFLTGCVTLQTYVADGATAYGTSPLAVEYVKGTKKISLNEYSLVLDKEISSHGNLPFLEEGGSYSSEAGGSYTFQINGEAAAGVKIIEKAEVLAGSGGTVTTSFTERYIMIGDGKMPVREFNVIEAVGSDSYIVFSAEAEMGAPVVVKKYFLFNKKGTIRKIFNTPSGFEFLVDGRRFALLGFYEKPVLYFSEFFVSSFDGKKRDAAMLCVLAAYESYIRGYDTTFELPSGE
jgi:hypothetical protein